ncbi:hypothetical protein BGZ83_007974 [Gryganskiella cystojenkinii]|nr:hypothetical protein BGZ83_007974 [Gryganskiella cystojenkinii]
MASHLPPPPPPPPPSSSSPSTSTTPSSPIPVHSHQAHRSPSHAHLSSSPTSFYSASPASPTSIPPFSPVSTCSVADTNHAQPLPSPERLFNNSTPKAAAPKQANGIVNNNIILKNTNDINNNTGGTLGQDNNNDRSRSVTLNLGLDNKINQDSRINHLNNNKHNNPSPSSSPSVTAPAPTHGDGPGAVTSSSPSSPSSNTTTTSSTTTTTTTSPRQSRQNTSISFSASLPPSLKQRPNPPARLKSDLLYYNGGNSEPGILTPANLHYTSSGQNSPGTSICDSDGSVPDSPMSGSDEADLLTDARSPLSALNKRKSLGALLAANTLAASSNSNNIIVNSASSSSSSRKEVLSPTFRARHAFHHTQHHQKSTSPAFSSTAHLPTPEPSSKKKYTTPTSPRVHSPSAISSQFQQQQQQHQQQQQQQQLSLWPGPDAEDSIEQNLANVDLDLMNFQETISLHDRDQSQSADETENDADGEGDDLDLDDDESWHSVDEDFGGETSAYHSDSPALPLVPFTNQVGGHASFLRFSNKAICKPVSENEQVFYEYLEAHHPEVLPFIPAYLGVLNVTYRQLPDPEDGDRPGEQVPEVVLEKNRHIVTDAMLEKMKKSWKWPSTPGRFPGSTVDIMEEGRSLGNRSGLGSRDRFQTSFYSSPSLPSHSSMPSASALSSPANSMTKVRGLTRINLALKEKVLKEVLSPHSLKARARAFRQHFGFPSKSRHDICSSSHDSPEEGGCRDYMKQVPRRHSLSNLNLAMTSREEHKRREMSTSDSAFQSGPEGSNSNQNNNTINNSNSGRALDPSPFEFDRQRRFSRTTGDSLSKDSPAADADSNENNQNDIFLMDDLELPETMLDSQSTLAQNGPTIQNNERSPSQAEDQVGNIIPIGRNEWILDGPRGSRGGHRSESTTHLRKDQDQQDDGADGEASKRCVPSDPAPGKYILLEDLTDGLKAPCILDIKMGTRQYGIWATEKKMKSQTRKCQKTTSYETGIRIFLYSVYNTTTGRFLFQNKYYGRKLTKETLPLTLREFLFNGSEVVLPIIPTLLRKLKDLAVIIKNLNGYRFYGSSLLIYYDGDSGHYSIPDSPQGRPIVNQSSSPALGATLTATAPSTSIATLKKYQDRSRADLKFIDFAHCTPGIFDKNAMPPYPPMHPNEPDKGYLLGLKNLMMIFREIWNQNGGDLTISQTWLQEEEALWSGVWE